MTSHQGNLNQNELSHYFIRMSLTNKTTEILQRIRERFGTIITVLYS